MDLSNDYFRVVRLHLSILIIIIAAKFLPMKSLDEMKSYFFLFFGFLSTSCLVSISFSLNSLEPLAEWAKLQKDCIDRTVAYPGLSSKVWSCNGGGE